MYLNRQVLLLRLIFFFGFFFFVFFLVLQSRNRSFCSLYINILENILKQAHQTFFVIEDILIGVFAALKGLFAASLSLFADYFAQFCRSTSFRVVANTKA